MLEKLLKEKEKILDFLKYMEGRREGWNDIVKILSEIEEKKLAPDSTAIQERLEQIIYQSFEEVNKEAAVKARRASFKLVVDNSQKNIFPNQA